MKITATIVFLLMIATAFGQVGLNDLPKPVTRVLSNHFKKQEIVLKELDSRNQALKEESFYAIFAGQTSEPTGYLHLGTVNTCRAGGCSASEPFYGADSKSEYFDYLIVFNNALAIENIQVFNYQASFGHEIAARGWLKQFQGFKGEKALEPGRDIDVISGATVSVHAITNDVQWKTKMLQHMIR